MLLAVCSGFLLAIFTPWLHRRLPRQSGLLLALLPAALFIYFSAQLAAVNDGDARVVGYPWVPGLDINLMFLLDGFSLLFGLLISGIGFLVLLYAGKYLQGHRDLGRLLVLLLCFMSAMLGVVFSDNLISLYVFWELTSITSYLLIGFNHEDEKARASALQSLLVTAGGGLVLLAGLVMLGTIGGSFQLSELFGRAETIQEHPMFLPTLLLIALGAFTKSAQFPFHFWLPNAMAAPTPVSAYLHSATMVKAGVYLLARLQPALAGGTLWFELLVSIGAITMFLGAFMAVRSTSIKRLLAYSTIMALGTLVMLIGIGTREALTAAMAFLLAHSLYKGALFLVAGIIDHGTGSKDFLSTGGFGRYMPFTAVATGLAALSLAGVLPAFGFIAKELMLEASLHAPAWREALLVVVFASSVLSVTAAAIVGIRPWFGRLAATSKPPHEASFALLAGPVVLSGLSLLFGVMPALAEHGVLAAAISAVHGAPVTPNLKIWHGLNTALVMSVSALVIGLLLFMVWGKFRQLTEGVKLLFRIGPERGYEKIMDLIVSFSAWQTRVLQNGYLRYYLSTILLSMVGLVVAAVMIYPNALILRPDFSDIRLYEYTIAGVLVAAALAAVTLQSRLSAVATLGAVGFCVALIYVLFSAPDLGITQVLVETLTVIMLVLVLFRLPRFLKLSSGATRLLDGLISITVGMTMTVLTLSVTATRYHSSISEYFVENSWPGGHGRNIVNVILVDFRALDTLGEIFVLSLAAVGVFAMAKLRAEDRR